MSSHSLRLRRPSSRRLVERIVYEPHLAASVQALAPRSLGKLINHIGVEDSGELIALATTKQIEKIFDDDLWVANKPGEEEKFDAARFVIWLQVMLEVGERFAAEKLEELPEDLVVLALQRSILVLNVDELQLTIGDDDESNRTEKALESSLYEEFDEHMVIARSYDGWDAILTVLLALDANNPRLRRRLLERCCALSEEYIADNGSLYDVLTSEQMLESDLAREREDRRSMEGYVAPAAAKSFLNLTRQNEPQVLSTMGRDRVAQMYLRSQRSSAQLVQSSSPKTGSKFDAAAASSLEALIDSISEEPAARHTASLRLADSSTPDHTINDHTLFRRSLERIAEQDPIAHGQRLDEIAFLCNVILSGCSISGRAIRPYEAVLATASTCNLGLERLAAEGGVEADIVSFSEILMQDGADGAFRLGASVLHHEVARKTVQAVLDRLRETESSIQAERELISQAIKAGDASLNENKPWKFGKSLWDLHELFDWSQIETLNALIGEIPLMTGGVAGQDSGPYRVDDRLIFISQEADLNRIAAYLSSI